MQLIYGEDYFKNYHPVWFVGTFSGNFNVNSFTSQLNSITTSISSNVGGGSGAGGGGGAGDADVAHVVTVGVDVATGIAEGAGLPNGLSQHRHGVATAAGNFGGKSEGLVAGSRVAAEREAVAKVVLQHQAQAVWQPRYRPADGGTGMSAATTRQ